MGVHEVVGVVAVGDGSLRWRWALPPGPSAFAQSPAATDGTRIFIGAWDTNVYALEAATGAEARAEEDRVAAASPTLPTECASDGARVLPLRADADWAANRTPRRVVTRIFFMAGSLRLLLLVIRLGQGGGPGCHPLDGGPVQAVVVSWWSHLVCG